MTDERIIRFIQDRFDLGMHVHQGDEISGTILESGQFYDGAQRGSIPFTHTVTGEDIRRALGAE